MNKNLSTASRAQRTPSANQNRVVVPRKQPKVLKPFQILAPLEILPYFITWSTLYSSIT